MSPFKFLFYQRNSRISKYAKIYSFTRITNSVVGNYSYVSYNCFLNNCTIGRFCSIATGVKIGLGKHPVNLFSTSPIFYSPKNALRVVWNKEAKFTEHHVVSIGNDVWIGANVTIVDGVKIGNGAIIGANSLVTKDVRPYSIVGGVPAKLIRMRFEEGLNEMLNKTKWWDLSITFLKSPQVIGLFSREITRDTIDSLKLLIEKETDRE